MRKPDFCICENKDADQLCGNRTANQRLCFRYTDSTNPLLTNPKSQVSNNLLWLYSPVCEGPSRKPRRPVFSQRGSYANKKTGSSRGCKQYPGSRTFSSPPPINIKWSLPNVQAMDHNVADQTVHIRL